MKITTMYRPFAGWRGFYKGQLEARIGGKLIALVLLEEEDPVSLLEASARLQDKLADEMEERR